MPYRVILFFSMIFGCAIFAALIIFFGPTDKIIKVLKLYLHTYGFFVIGRMCKVSENFSET